MDYKIKSATDLHYIAKIAKAKGEKIATTNGAFDILHPGHLHSLYRASEYGKLVVCLNSDASVKRYKGEDRPFFNQDERAKMLSALEMVSYVTIFDEDDPRKVLDAIKPNYHVKSRTGYKGIEGDVVKKNGGEIVLIDDLMVEGRPYSTTDIADWIQDMVKGFMENGGLI